MKKFIIGLWVLFFMGVIAAFGVFYAITQGKIGYMPPVEELENPNYKFATQILSEEGEILGTWSLSTENRVYTTYDEIPKNVIQALIATEDVRFYHHSGIDLKALVRAIIKRGVLQQKNAGGGSTITQQLSKQLFSPRADNVMERLFQKPIEWVIAVQLERYYTKEEILTMYLNKFDFLNNAVGIKTASHTYFGKEPMDLSDEEAATLVGMCKNPSRYNPLRFNERSKGRRNTVLSQMQKAGFLTSAHRDSLQLTDLELNYHRVDHKEGLATYFREYLRGVMNAKKPERANYRGWQLQKFHEDSVAWATDPLYGWCAKNYKKNGENYSIYTDGLKIYTSINAKMQKYAEEAVQEHVEDYLQPAFFKEKRGRKKAPYSNSLTQEEIDRILWRTVRQTERYRLMKNEGASDAEIKKAFQQPQEMSIYTLQGERDTVLAPIDSIRYYKHFLRTGFMAMDPMNGHVKAYVGGTNYNHFQYDMAMVGRRQIGSTLKPFLYSLAMENGFSPCDQARHVQQTLLDENGRPWTPRNSTRARIGEMVTLKWGLANSSNWISAYLMGKLNPYALVRLIHNFGVLNQDIQPTVSLALGPCEISVGEMVSAYTAFANKGIRVAPLFVTRIEDSEGNVISNFTPQMDEVISANSAYKMLDMLRSVVNEGTGGRVRRYGFAGDAGGKTGTSNDNSDAWFMGFTPQLVGGVWVGGEDRDIHFDGMFFGQGAAAALPIWVKFFKKVYEDKDLGYDIKQQFELPEGFDPCKDAVEGEDLIQSDQPSELDELFY